MQEKTAYTLISIIVGTILLIAFGVGLHYYFQAREKKQIQKKLDAEIQKEIEANIQKELQEKMQQDLRDFYGIIPYNINNFDINVKSAVSCFTNKVGILFCPDRKKTGQDLTSKMEKNPDPGYTRLYLSTDCLEGPTFISAVGERVPSGLNGFQLNAKEITYFDVPWGADIKIFGRNPCTITNTMNITCKDCNCNPDPKNKLGCADLGFNCSYIHFQSDSEGKVSYRVIHPEGGFSMTYLVSGCQDDVGGNLEYSRPEILNFCPPGLKGIDLLTRNTKQCLSPSNVCKLNEDIKNCQCSIDYDCHFCKFKYLNHTPVANNRLPFYCDQETNRCSIKKRLEKNCETN